MAGDRREHRLHVLRNHHWPTREQGPCARGGQQHQARARAQAPARAGLAAGACRLSRQVSARRREQRLHVIQQRRRDVNGSRLALPLGKRRGIALRREIDEPRPTVTPGEQLALGHRIRITQLDCEKKAVELRFGQRVRADLLDRILRRDHEERLGQRARLAVERNLAFLHCLEQRALRLRRRSIDLVGEHDRVEDGSGMESKRLRALVEHRYAEHVCRQQVARELNARVLEAEHSREGLRERGLADARNVLDQEVPAREQARERELQRLILADDDLRELLQHHGKAVGSGNVLGRGANGHLDGWSIRGVDYPAL